MSKEDVNDYIEDRSVFRIGQVIEVVGQKVRVGIDTGKNAPVILYKGDVIENIAVNGYIKIKKGFEEMIGKIEEESVKEKDTRNVHASSEDKVSRVLTVKILGSMEEGSFKRGLRELPLIDNTCYLLTKKEFEEIHDFVDENDEPINMGVLEYNEGQQINLGVNKLFASHIGIFGNTGSGKSYTLAKMLREVFLKFQNIQNFKDKARFVLIDFNGEYEGSDVIVASKNKVVSKLTTDSVMQADEKVHIKKSTLYEAGFWVVLLEATEKTQAPFLEDTFKNSYVLRILESPNFSKSVIKEIISIINRGIKREDKNIGVKLFTEFFSKLRSCVAEEEMEKIGHARNFIESRLMSNNTNGSYYVNPNPNPQNPNAKYWTEHIEKVVTELAQILNGISFEMSDVLKIRLVIILNFYGSIVNGFGNREHLSGLVKRLIDNRVDDLDNLVCVGDIPGNMLRVVSLRDVKINMRKMIPLLLVKEIYAEKKRENDKSKSLHIVIDEAHNVLSEKSERETEHWKDYRLETFEEIIKEGRKFGVFLSIASQRPSDISPTILSQLHNYFLHRLVNNNDLKSVERTIAYLDKVSSDSIPNLPTGTCILAGLIAQVPVVLKVGSIEKEENQPQSRTIDLLKNWK